MKTSTALIAAAALLSTSCVSEYFTLNEGAPDVLYGKIMTEIDSVELASRTTLRVHSGGVAALRNYEITQCRWELQATLARGTATVYRVRTVPVEWTLTPSIAIVYSTTGCRVQQQERVLAQVDSVRAVPGVAEKIQITNDGSYLTVVIGCVQVFHGQVQQPATEWLVVESPSGSEVLLSHVVTEETR